MPLTYINYTGDGTTRDYLVPFPYLDRDYIHVYVNNDEIDQASLEWLSDASLRLPEAPIEGAVISIKRETDRTEPVTDFRNGSTLTEEDLDNQTLQLLHIAQEVYDLPEGLSDAVDRAEGIVVDTIEKTKALAKAVEASTQALVEKAASEAVKAQEAAQKAQNLANIGPLTEGSLGLAMTGPGIGADAEGHLSVIPGAGLSLNAEAKTVNVNPSASIYVDKEDNALKTDMEHPGKGILAVAHGGTGSGTPQGALENLGLAAWQKGMENTNPQRLRNVILSGREKDGYPAYLVGQEFIDMQHEDGVYISKRGTVSASGEYSTSYRATKPLRNQLVYQSTGWLTPNTVTSGQWEYAFADRAHVLTGLYLQNFDNSPQYFPRKWQLQGWNESSGLWEDIYRRDNDQALRGSPDNLKDNGRMYWFTENATAYRRVRINIESNHGGAYSQLSVIRLYEAVIPGLHKYDLALYATPETPFAASVACGLSADGTARTLDHPVKVTEHVVFDGRKLAEMSRNYIYVVPADESTGHLPANLDADRAVPLPGNAAFLYADTRKLHYGTRGDIEKECFALLQSRHTVAYDPAPNGMFEMNQGAWNHPLYFQNVRVDPTEKPRGAASSYRFAGVDNWIGPNADLTASLLGRNAHPYSNECTVELDFKWNGPAPETTDDYFILYDNGYYTSRGWALGYHNRKKCLALHWGSKSISNWCYHVPFNAVDGTWHTVSVSQRDSSLFIHVDGVCLGAFNNVSPCNPNYRYWFLGRWIHSGSRQWYGHLNNLRVTLGTALYQGRDYAVSPRFNSGLIPDRTLWYNAAEGVVKEWQADTGVWLKTPMLPVGHVDTGRKEHLMTDQPRGTYHLQPTKWVTDFKADSSYDGNAVANSLFDLGYGGAHAFLSGGTNDATHAVEFALEKPLAFESMLDFVSTRGNWNSSLCKFRLSGRNADEEAWNVLIDRSTFIDDGALLGAGVYAAPNGTSPYFGGYKSFAISDPTPYRQYQLYILPKNDVPFFKDYNYTSVLLTFTFRDARPELLGISSYATGEAWTIGPVPLGLNTEAEIPVPFGNLPFSVDGCVEEEQDCQVRKRRLGELSGWYSNGYCVTGEVVYQKSDAVVLVTGNHAISHYNGASWNSPSVNTQSNKANYYLSLRRRGV